MCSLLCMWKMRNQTKSGPYSVYKMPSISALEMHIVGTKSEVITRSGNNKIPMPPSEYICFDCRKNLQYELPLLKAKTTLVMMPLHIAMQWISELRKHLGEYPRDKNVVNKYYCEGQVHNIRYLLYPGISVILRQMNSKSCTAFCYRLFA